MSALSVVEVVSRNHFPLYSSYKASGVQWLGNIPTHWKVMRLKQLLSEPLMYGANEAADSALPENPRFVRITDIADNGELREETFRSLPFEAAKAYLLKDGDILLARSGATVGKSFIYSDSWGLCCFAGYLIKARANPDFALPSFLYSTLQTDFYWHYIVREQIQATIQNVSAEKYGEFSVPVPPLSEQTAIATFLDRETAKIDALIAEQEKLIALLAEKRQATISHAVTKGLNPDALMKDSGVAWLGEVPAHWDVLTFQRCVLVAEGQVDPEAEPFRSLLLVAPNHVESGTGRLLYGETAEEQAAESGKYLCNQGDVIYSKIRPGLRKVCIAPEPCLCSADMYPLRGTAGLLNRFLMWFMLSEPFSAFAVLESERVAMPKINRESLKAVWLPLPPSQEQECIASFLSAETQRLDELAAEATRGIALLKERRSALISAAVTGKIDVRHLAEAEAA